MVQAAIVCSNELSRSLPEPNAAPGRPWRRYRRKAQRRHAGERQPVYAGRCGRIQCGAAFTITDDWRRKGKVSQADGRQGVTGQKQAAKEARRLEKRAKKIKKIKDGWLTERRNLSTPLCKTGGARIAGFPQSR